MNPVTNPTPNPDPVPSEQEPMAAPDRLMVFMFFAGLALFGGILLLDLLRALFLGR